VSPSISASPSISPSASFSPSVAPPNYEYYYENVVVTDLQNFAASVISSEVVGEIIGVSSGSAGITGVSFASELDSTNLNLLHDHMTGISGTAEYIKMELNDE